MCPTVPSRVNRLGHQPLWPNRASSESWVYGSQDAPAMVQSGGDGAFATRMCDGAQIMRLDRCLCATCSGLPDTQL